MNIDIEIFLGEDNPGEDEEASADEDEHDLDGDEEEEKELGRAPSQLRQSGIAGAGGGMEGFEGIVGIGAAGGLGAGKKGSLLVSKTGAGAGGLKKPIVEAVKKKEANKETGPPLSLGIFGSGMQKKWTYVKRLANSV